MAKWADHASGVPLDKATIMFHIRAMTHASHPELAALIEDFALIDDWEERYRYVIELGKSLPAMPEELKTAATKVSGCASQVWIFTRPEEAPPGTTLALTGDSDALIVKGLMAVAFIIFHNRTLSEIAATDAVAIFDTLGLREHLTPQRSNGLASMVTRIKADAERFCGQPG
jgi:cysteine desulfuration protein SufE